MSNVSPSRFQKPEPFGSATTAAPPEVSALGPLTDAHIAAIAGRGLDVELIVRLGVGASAKLGSSAIGIPTFDGSDIDGNPVRVGCKHRTLTGDKRFTQDTGSRQIFWNLDCLRDASLAQEPVIITEGELDAMSAIQAGYQRVVSVPGGAPSEAVGTADSRKYAFLTEALSLLKDCTVIILATDGDDPGANLRADLALRLGAHRCKWVQYPKGCKDLNDALRIYGERGVQATIHRATPMRINGYFEMSELPELAEPRAFDTGIIGLGDHYKLRLGDMCVVTGVPGHGKSSFINEICCRMTQHHGWKTVFASFEQTPQTDLRRALRSFHGERLEKMMSTQMLSDADAWIRKHFGFIVPDPDEDVTLEWILTVLKQAVLRKEAQIVVIDPWNQMDHTRPSEMTQTEYVGWAIKELKRFAAALNVHLIVAAHPAKMARMKDGTYPVPSLYDISDSAHWANRPDVGIVIHRPSPTNNESLIRVVKTRYQSIGLPGEITGAWDVHRTRYLITERTA